MNDRADLAANAHQWTNIPYPLQRCNRIYATLVHKQVTTQHPGKKWKEMQYERFKQDWKKRQPVRTLFTNSTVDKASLPKKQEHYANLTCKILTGTIWTAKLKKRLKMQETDICTLCNNDDESHIEDAEHALGKCKWTQQRNDEAWEEIIQLGKKYNMNTDTWMPWFHTSQHHSHSYDMPATLGDKGLTPTMFCTRIYNDNKHINKKILKKKIDKIIQFWRWATRTNYIKRATAQLPERAFLAAGAPPCTTRS